MREALESLPWVRKAEVDLSKEQAVVTVVSDQYDEQALLDALKKAGYGGTEVKSGA
ncbi:MAG: heavy-metal-associated domain-containing protein [Pirellulales bacterium]